MTRTLDPQGRETRALLEAADFRGARVLEIGVGDGRLTRRYSGVAAFAAGIDLSLKELDSARLGEGLGSESRTAVELLQATALALPFRRESFDIAVFAWSL